MSIIVNVVKLEKRYQLGHEVVEALRGVSLTLARGEFTAIMGASGSGKTTLLHLVGGLDVPSSGHVDIDGQCITRMGDDARTLFRRRHVGIVFQAYNLLPHLTARENVMLPLLIEGKSAADIAPRADELMRLVRLDHRENHRPDALSGGEQQRVAIARALLTRPALLLADEPTGNLDPAAAQQVWDLLRSLANEHQTTVLMVTHESAAAAHADRTLVLRAGEVIGEIKSEGGGDAALVAARYAQLAV